MPPAPRPVAGDASRPRRRRLTRRRASVAVWSRRMSARIPVGPPLLVLATVIALVSLRATPPETVAATGSTSVVVATVELDSGSIVAPDDIELRAVPTPGERTTVLLDVDRVIGRQVTATIYEGEAVLEGRLAPGGLVGIAAATPAGWSSFAIPATSALPPAEVGQRVDLYALEPQTDLATARGGTSHVASGALVVAVDDQRVSVAVDPADAAGLAAALAATTVVVAITGPEGGP